MKTLATAALGVAVVTGVFSLPAHANVGTASYYGPGFAGKKTASGERFNPGGLTAAHRSYPFGTRLKLTNMANGRVVVVRVNDRGPFVHGRVLDVSHGAARALGMTGAGTARLKIEAVTGRAAAEAEEPAPTRAVPTPQAVAPAEPAGEDLASERAQETMDRV